MAIVNAIMTNPDILLFLILLIVVIFSWWIFCKKIIWPETKNQLLKENKGDRVVEEFLEQY